MQMTKLVKQNDKYVMFETQVRDLDIFARIELTSYINLATEFVDEADAKEYIGYVKASGYDTSNLVIVDKEEIQKAKEEQEHQEQIELLKNKLSGLNEEAKRALITTLSESDRKLVTEALGETIEPFSDEELAERRIQRLEKTLGITFTEEQKQILRQQKEN